MSRPLGEKAHIYDSNEFTVPLNTTNYDVATNQASFCANCSVASGGERMCGKIRILTDKTIGIRLNLVTNPLITITSSESPYIIEDVIINNIFITTTDASALKITQFYI